MVASVLRPHHQGVRAHGGWVNPHFPSLWRHGAGRPPQLWQPMHGPAGGSSVGAAGVPQRDGGAAAVVHGRREPRRGSVGHRVLPAAAHWGGPRRARADVRGVHRLPDQHRQELALGSAVGRVPRARVGGHAGRGARGGVGGKRQGRGAARRVHAPASAGGARAAGREGPERALPAGAGWQGHRGDAEEPGRELARRSDLRRRGLRAEAGIRHHHQSPRLCPPSPRVTTAKPRRGVLRRCSTRCRPWHTRRQSGS